MGIDGDGEFECAEDYFGDWSAEGAMAAVQAGSSSCGGGDSSGRVRGGCRCV